MSRLQAINGHSVFATVPIHGEMFVSAVDDWVRSIIRSLDGFAYSIVADEDVSGSRKVITQWTMW